MGGREIQLLLLLFFFYLTIVDLQYCVSFRCAASESFLSYYKILNIVPCVIQYTLAVDLFSVEWCVLVTPIFLIYPSLLPFPLVP